MLPLKFLGKGNNTIYTITLNPALDRTLWVQRIRDDVSNCILEEKSFAGGKSIDVSRILKNLGMDNTGLLVLWAVSQVVS